MNLILSLTYSSRLPLPLKVVMVFPYDIFLFLQMRLNFQNSDSIFLRKSFTIQVQVVKDFLKKIESEFLKSNHIYRKGKMSYGKTMTTLWGGRTQENTSVTKSSSYLQQIFFQNPEMTSAQKRLFKLLEHFSEHT